MSDFKKMNAAVRCQIRNLWTVHSIQKQSVDLLRQGEQRLISLWKTFERIQAAAPQGIISKNTLI